MDDTLGAVAARGRPRPPGLLGERRGEGFVRIKRVCASLGAATEGGAEEAQTAVRPTAPSEPSCHGTRGAESWDSRECGPVLASSKDSPDFQPAVPAPGPGSVLPL